MRNVTGDMIRFDVEAIGSAGRIASARFAAWLVVAGMLPFISVGRAAPSSPGRPPNIIVVLADQWRAQAFGFAGDPNVKTPHFDRLAQESVQFTNAVAGMPVCSPTRASLLTGQRPLTHGIFLNDVLLNPIATTLPKVLRTAGYDTGAIGKWHVDGNGRSNFIPRERRQGFDFWQVLECTHDYNMSAYYGDGPQKQFWQGYDAFEQTRVACDYIKSRGDAGRPFFLWLAWGPPHSPYHTAPDKYNALYDPSKLTLRPNVPPEFADAARKDLAGYYAHCSALDDAMGEILATLRTRGLEENTIVVFSSDHGDMHYSQGMLRKQKPYDESVCVPLLVRWPAGIGREPRKLDATFNSEDLMPTLLGLAGVEVPSSVEGVDYSGYLRGGRNPGDDGTILTCVSPFGEFARRLGGKEYRGLRTTRHTYVRDLQGPWLLFDNVQDPFQIDNLVGRPEAAALQATLDRRLKEKLKKQGDEFLAGHIYVARWGYKLDANGKVPYTR